MYPRRESTPIACSNAPTPGNTILSAARMSSGFSTCTAACLGSCLLALSISFASSGTGNKLQSFQTHHKQETKTTQFLHSAKYLFEGVAELAYGIAYAAHVAGAVIEQRHLAARFLCACYYSAPPAEAWCIGEEGWPNWRRPGLCRRLHRRRCV